VPLVAIIAFGVPSTFAFVACGVTLDSLAALGPKLRLQTFMLVLKLALVVALAPWGLVGVASAVVLAELLRIARRAVISFPNFGHWRVRLSLLAGGRMPMTPALPVPWYATPNIHLCSIDDFRALAAALDVTVERATFLSAGKRVTWAGNLRAEQAVFVLRRG